MIIHLRCCDCGCYESNLGYQDCHATSTTRTIASFLLSHFPVFCHNNTQLFFIVYTVVTSASLCPASFDSVSSFLSLIPFSHIPSTPSRFSSSSSNVLLDNNSNISNRRDQRVLQRVERKLVGSYRRNDSMEFIRTIQEDCREYYT